MSLVDMLRGGDHRSIGRADEVVDIVLSSPSRFDEVFNGILSDDSLIRMRCADAAEKIAKTRPNLLAPFKEKLIGEVALIDQQEVQWHLAQMMAYLQYTDEETATVVRILRGLLSSKSRIVVVSSLDTLTELATRDASLRESVIKDIENAMENGAPSVKSRGKRLLGRLSGDN